MDNDDDEKATLDGDGVGSQAKLSPQTKGKIAMAVTVCLEAFRELLVVLKQENSTSENAFRILRDEETRFKVWSGNIGAHKKGRSSLEYRLRDASHLQKQVLRLLEDLMALLGDASAILKGDKVPWDKLDEGPLRDGETSDCSEITETELDQISTDVFEVVSCLLRLSVSIRNPAPHDRFRASASTETDYYIPFDVQHVQSKFGSTASHHLAERLGKAISRRRQYFRYRENHHAKLIQGLDPDQNDDPLSTIASSIPRHMKDPGAANTTQVVDEDTRSDTGVSETSFASSAAGTVRLRLPPLPKEAHIGPFECPFCFMMIAATNTISWKRHVYGDLRPYTCLSEDCETPDQEFVRRRDWMQHEMQNHWKTYSCPLGCPDDESSKFSSAMSLKTHLTSHHKSQITAASQLDALIDLSARPRRMENGVACPLCGDALFSIQAYRRHVGRHQEQISLFALPNIAQACDEDSTDENESTDTDGNGDADFDPFVRIGLQDEEANARTDKSEEEEAFGIYTTSLGPDSEVIPDYYEGATVPAGEPSTAEDEGFERTGGLPYLQRQIDQLSLQTPGAESSSPLRRNESYRSLISLVSSRISGNKDVNDEAKVDENGEDNRSSDGGRPPALTSPQASTSPILDSSYEYSGPSDLARYDLDLAGRPPRRGKAVLQRQTSMEEISTRGRSPPAAWAEKSPYYTEKARPRARSPVPDPYTSFRHTADAIIPPRPGTSRNQEPIVTIEYGGPASLDDRRNRGPPPTTRGLDKTNAQLTGAPSETNKSPTAEPSVPHEASQDPGPQQTAVTGILKKPTPLFPEEPNPVREGVAPHKDDKSKIIPDIPPGARWTKISRKLVNPEALTIGRERFEVRDDFVIVLRVLSKEEVQAYADATAVLRDRRRQELGEKPESEYKDSDLDDEGRLRRRRHRDLEDEREAVEKRGEDRLRQSPPRPRDVDVDDQGQPGAGDT